MKFGKQLEDERIPEWRDKYLNYKRGKKNIHDEDLSAWLDNELVKIETFYREREAGALEYLSKIKEQIDILASQREHDDRHRAVYSRVRESTASRKLKHALLEFYHEVEQLQEYAKMNEEAFRKINKKADKAARKSLHDPNGMHTSNGSANGSANGSSYSNEDKPTPELKFYRDKVKKVAHFATSNVMDDVRKEILDLYAQNFEQGNAKDARIRLNAYHRDPHSHSGSAFRNGIMIAGGTVLGVQGLVDAVDWLNVPSYAVETSYLLQLYAGFFLPVLLSILFCLALKAFDAAHINYSLVLELNPRTRKSWAQLIEIPAMLYLLLCLVLFLNFSSPTARDMYQYWPLIVLGLFALVIAVPAPIIYYKTRQWISVSTLRTFTAGAINVHFRDFFLGDLFCSLTYTFGNIELISCLYIRHWHEPDQCNSSHSMALGFLATLPLIIRFCQCWRRYFDSGLVFPNIVNSAKYLASIVYYMLLSLYRLHRDGPLGMRYFIPFVLFATINSVYCTMWDILIDWSLGNWKAPAYLLRRELAFKWRTPYYIAMVLDPLIRFNWVFYLISPREWQHSSLLAFFVAFSEILRRAIWLVFRIENEHCSNVVKAHSTRDVTLPYPLRPASVGVEFVPQTWWDRVGNLLHFAHSADFTRQDDYDPSLAMEDEDEDDV